MAEGTVPLSETGECDLTDSQRMDTGVGVPPLGAAAAALQDLRRYEPPVPSNGWLERTIEQEIIPRLMLAHRAPFTAGPAQQQPALVEPIHVEELVQLLIDHDSTVASAYVAAFTARGTRPDAVYLQLLAPAARRLGEMWVADECSFTQVTIGLSSLHVVLHETSLRVPQESSNIVLDHRALLVPAPGEQHTFGIIMVSELLRRAGWDVSAFPTASSELRALVRNESFALVGFSLSCDLFLDDLAAEIRAVRQASRNRSMVVMVGGRFFADNPDEVSRVGADASARDGEAMVRYAETLRLMPAARS